MRDWLRLGAALILTGSAGGVQAESVDTVAAAFGAREDITDISLSPGGGMIAMVGPLGPRGYAARVVDMAKGGTPTTILTGTGAGEYISDCSWPSDTRVICTIMVQNKATGQITAFSRVVSLDPAGNDAKILTKEGSGQALGFVWYGGDVIDWQGRKPDEILMQRAFVPEYSTGTRLAETDAGLGVESVNVTTLRRTIVERPVRDGSIFISDGRGTVRVMGTNPSSTGGYDKPYYDYLYRKAGERSWNTLGRVTINPNGTRSGFRPVAVDADLDIVYGFESVDGFTALHKMSLDGSGKREVVFAKSGVDIDGLVRIGRNQRVVGVSYATEYRQVDYFDPALAKLRTALGKALASGGAIGFEDSSQDESKLLMSTSSDVDPGKYYLFDKTTRKLEEILPVRPGLAGRALGEMKPVQFPAADGTMIPGYLTLPPGSSGKNLPAIVMPHGGPAARDEWGFDWFAQFFVARGFAVLQPNYRGSAGYGEGWFEKNGFQSWRTAIGDVNDAGRWLLSSGVAAPGKLAIVGWSYGGYAALQSSVLDPALFKAIVAVAPVTDLELRRQNFINYTSYKLVDAQIGQGPHVTQGSPAANAGAFRAPVLMFHGDLDANVDIGHSERMEKRLREAGKPVELVKFPGLEHSLVDSQVRTQMLKQSDAFLRRSLGLPPE